MWSGCGLAVRNLGEASPLMARSEPVTADDKGMAQALSYALRQMIRGYRRFVSPLLGQHCRFYPSCSEYAYQAIAKHGVARGGLLAVKRLLRCHPFHPGGVDHVPDVSSSRTDC